MLKEEFFGNDEQQALLRRGRAMAALLCHDPRYSYYGRTVGLIRPEDGDIDRLAALVKLQGRSNYFEVPPHEIDTVTIGLKERGLVPVHYARWEGAAASLAAARKVVKTFSLPKDVTLIQLDAKTPAQHLVSLAALALNCGVLPLCGEVLRGLLQPAVCLAAMDRSGNVVSCAASSTFAHPDHPTFGGQAWWGMLATHPARRGQRLALILCAYVLLEMETRFGLRDFMTGVEPGNAPSEAVCTRMGFASGKFAVIGCADPHALTAGRMTK